jgi:hypothetical protein
MEAQYYYIFTLTGTDQAIPARDVFCSLPVGCYGAGKALWTDAPIPRWRPGPSYQTSREVVRRSSLLPRRKARGRIFEDPQWPLPGRGTLQAVVGVTTERALRQAW